MRSTPKLAVLVLCAAALGAGCTHSIRRAALVPHQQPIAHSGTLVRSPEVSVGSPSLASTRKPRVAASENAGIVIPRWQGQGALRLPWGNATTIGFHVDYGLDQDSVALSDDQPDPKGDTMGAAVSMFYTAIVSPDFEVGVGGQLWLYSIPYVEYDTCVNCLGGVYTEVDHDRNLIPVVSIGILPTFKVAPNVSLFGGVNIRNHPTIEKSDFSIGPESDVDEEVESGPPNAIASIGGDIMLTHKIRLTGYLHRPIAAKPVVYGVTAGFMLTFVAQDSPAGMPSTSL